MDNPYEFVEDVVAEYDSIVATVNSDVEFAEKIMLMFKEIKQKQREKQDEEY